MRREYRRYDEKLSNLFGVAINQYRVKTLGGSLWFCKSSEPKIVGYSDKDASTALRFWRVQYVKLTGIVDNRQNALPHKPLSRTAYRDKKNRKDIAEKGLIVRTNEEGLTYTLVPIPTTNPFKDRALL